MATLRYLKGEDAGPSKRSHLRHTVRSIRVLYETDPEITRALLPQPLRATFGMRSRSFDIVASDVADRAQNALHVPLNFEPDPKKFANDGYHPSEESYAEFGRHMADSLLNAKTG